MSKKKSSKSAPAGFTNFLKTWAGRITAFTAFVLALSGAIAGLEKIGVIDLVKQAVPKGDDEIPRVTIKAANVMPYCLKNSIGSREFPYWFHIEFTNTTKKPLTLQVAFEDYRGPGKLRIKSKSFDYIKPNETLSRTLDPFKLMVDDIEEGKNDRIKVTCRVLDSAKKTLNQLEHDFELLPKNVLAWDLKKPEGELVSQEFLVASLGAWVLATSKNVVERAERIVQGVDPASVHENPALQWFSSSYSNVFGGLVRIQSMTGAFPPTQRERRQIVRTPSQVLGLHVADPLEAGLLFGALTKKKQALHRIQRLVLLAVEAEDDAQKGKEFFLCWFTGQEWYGLNMNLVDQKSFEENMTAASQRVRNLFEKKPDILRKLDSPGVYIEKVAIVAVDFDKAKAKFGIRGLP